MELKFIIGWSVAVVVLAVSSHAIAEPLECHVNVSSLGAAVDVTRTDPSPTLPFQVPLLQILWHPPTEDTSPSDSANAMTSFSTWPNSAAMDLIIVYRGATLKALGVSTGGRLQFSPGIGTKAAEFQAVVTDGDNQVWHFDVDPDFGAQQGDFIFSTDDPAGKAVIDAINDGKIINIEILKDGKAAASETFYTSAIAGRDRLLALARPIIEASNPRYCRPF